jgi:penicillin-binding protein 1C
MINRRLRTIRQFIRRRWKHLLLIVSLISAGIAIFIYQWLFADLPSLDTLDRRLAAPTTRILDRQGRLLYEIIDPQGGFNTVVSLSALPKALINATIATEDRGFYTHPGVDPVGVVRAVWINLQGGEIRAGGSTITQQVARTLLLDPDQRLERTLTRKLKEMILALRLTARYTREEILALYLNQSYYGNLAYGVGAASNIYFGKPASQLDLAESALIAGLPQSPGLYNPLTDPARAKERQKNVLRLMVEAGYLTQAEANQAYTQPLQFTRNRFPIQAPHFALMVWEQLRERYPDQLREGGLTVRTTLNLDWQNTAERIARAHIQTLKNPPPGQLSKRASNSAIVALNPKDGQVMALVGSLDYFDSTIDGSVNMALAPRQPGSALKPFTYALTFSPNRPNGWSPATMVLDISTPFVTRRLESYAPANFALNEHGPVSIREALASSYNIPAVVALDQVGVGALLNLLTRLGVTTLRNPDRYDLSLTLGGGEVRLIDLTAAYTAFANEGVPTKPQFILEITGKNGNALYTWQAPARTPPVIDPRVAYLINDILSDNTARIPSFGDHSPLQIGRPAASKTGTTTDFRDNWTIGYTPSLVVGVWVGNADNTPMLNVSGVTGAGPIWNDLMREVLADQPEESFTPPEGVVQVEVCALSGMLPTPYCPRNRYDWFLSEHRPTKPDTFYQKFVIDRLTGTIATPTTPADRREERIYLVLPQEARSWALRRGIPQPPGVLSSVGGKPGTITDGVRLLSPDPYTEFQLSPLLPFDKQQIPLTAAVSPGAVRVRYQVNGETVGDSSEAPYTVWWTLKPGQYRVQATAFYADGSQRESEPIPYKVGSYALPEARPDSGTLP